MWDSKFQHDQPFSIFKDIAGKKEIICFYLKHHCPVSNLNKGDIKDYVMLLKE